MKQLIEKNMTFILYGAGAITLVMSGWVNKDSLIIPKAIILWALSAFLLPQLIYSLKVTSHIKEIRFLTVIILFMTLNIVISSIVSSAPFEQQFYGRTGRGLGIATQLCLLILILATIVFSNKDSIGKLVRVLVFAGSLSTIYTLLQSFGLDFIQWETRTHGLTGTLGNPNFQGSLAAILIPLTIALGTAKKNYRILAVILFCILVFTVYRTKATQGILLTIFSILVYLIIYLWFKYKFIFKVLLGLFISVGIYVIAGTLGHGYLSSYLYKTSVQSRGDFWRAAFSMANDNPIFGVGIDSFGDYFLQYRDQIAVNHNFAEFTDNSHNYVLESASTIGYFYMFAQIVIILITFLLALKTIRSHSKINHYLVSVFIAWAGLQLQFLISPGSISLLVWNSILTGTLIYQAIVNQSGKDLNSYLDLGKIDLLKPISYLFLIILLTISFPYFNTDRLQLKAMNTGNGDLAIESSQKFPESVLRYATMIRELLNSNLAPQALELAKKGVEFNPNSASLWVLILINPTATLEERQFAKVKIIELDPLNKEVLNYNVS